MFKRVERANLIRIHSEMGFWIVTAIILIELQQNSYWGSKQKSNYLPIGNELFSFPEIKKEKKNDQKRNVDMFMV